MANELKTKTETSVLFGEWLIHNKTITQQQLSEALSYQQSNGCRLGEAITKLGFLTDEEVAQALANYLTFDYFPLDDLTKIDLDIARTLPENIARKLTLVPIGQMDNKVVVAMADPLNIVAIDTVTIKLKRMIKVMVSCEKNILHAIDAIYHGSDVEEQRLRDLVQNEVIDEEEDINLVVEDDASSLGGGDSDANQAPVVRFVDLLLSQAVKSRASDIHVEPQEDAMMIRMRVDGSLREMITPPKKMESAVIARMKILARMDIAEKRLPQDGRFKIKANKRDIDLRVNTLPTIYGEKVVMRILDKSAVNHDISALGFDDRRMEQFKTALDQPHGILIVTGPTGSGKSTTLYTALGYLKDPRKNIITVENPVEYRLAGINQVQVRQEINFDFASCLRAILRQDPDIILVGEIRDKETVDIAMKASLTGHMVLSTLHTNDAPSAVTRFIHMGVEPYLLASTLNLIIAQRLVKRICSNCKVEMTIDDEDTLNRLKIDKTKAAQTTFYRGKGCPQCGGTGYAGRLPIFEFLAMNREIRHGILDGCTEAQIREISRKLGNGDLQESGVSNIYKGLTTPEEVMNVTFEEGSE